MSSHISLALSDFPQILLYYENFIIKNFKHIEKLKGLFSEHT